MLPTVCTRQQPSRSMSSRRHHAGAPDGSVLPAGGCHLRRRACRPGGAGMRGHVQRWLLMLGAAGMLLCVVWLQNTLAASVDRKSVV